MLLATLCSGLGCSVGTPPEPTSLEVAERSLAALERCRPLSSERARAYVYRCDTKDEPLFVTTMRQCGVPDKLSYQATTRQLLVGITNLELLNQAPVTLTSAKALRSIVRGMLDADHILVATFTRRSEDCITDIVIWRASTASTESGSEVDSFTLMATELAASIQSGEPHSRKG
jgi:hypothetical protein